MIASCRCMRMVLRGMFTLFLLVALTGCGPKPLPAVVTLNVGEDPTIWYVATTGTDTTGSCHTPATACRTIQFVLDQAADGHTIYIADGVYTGHVLVEKDVAIIGAGPGTILENPVAPENKPYRGGVIAVECNQCNGAASISNLTVRNGTATVGGGISVYFMTLNLQDVLIEGSSATWGGCLAVNSDSAAALERVTLTGCQVDGQGGGLSNDGQLTMADSRISGNTSTYLAGGLSNYGTASLTDVLVENNTAVEIGGGIVNHDVLTIAASTIVGNEAFDDGGLSNYGDATIIASTISANKGNAGAGIGHGGTESRSGSMYLYNVTISGNEGNGIQISNELQTLYGAFLTIADNTQLGLEVMGPTSVYLVNTLFVRNGGSLDNVNNHMNCGFMWGGQLSGNSNMSDDGSCFTYDGALPALAGRLGPLQDNGGPTRTHALLAGSPAIDAGANLSYNGAAVDQRGASRPLDGDEDGQPRNDVGAYEYSPQAAILQPDQVFLPPQEPPALFVPDQPTNCRQGPGVVYPAMTSIPAGATFAVNGKNETGDWVRLWLGEEKNCWVRVDLGVLHGDSLQIVLRDAPPTPVPTERPTEVPTAIVVCSHYTTQSACEAQLQCFWGPVPPTGSPGCMSR